MTDKALLPQMKAVMATNISSKFTDFSIKLDNGATLTGIVYIPQREQNRASSGKPLLVAIHGATCCAYTYDMSPEYTAATYADRFGLPLIAFNRPNFLGSSGWLVDHSSFSPTTLTFKAREGLTFFEEEGYWYHELIFPAIWKEFALPNGCTSIVTTSHSMSVPMTIIAASLYADGSASYVWGGVVLSGLSVVPTACSLETMGKGPSNKYSPDQLPFGQDPSIHAPPLYEQDKVELMLGHPGLCDSSLGPLVWKQNTPLFIGEAVDLSTTWPANREKYQALVKIPVLYGLGEYDWLWKGTRENVSAFCAGFASAARVEGAVVEGGAHAIELSPVSEGWWARVFGWAIEVDVGLRIRSDNYAKYS